MNHFCVDASKYVKRYIYNKEMDKRAIVLINSVHNKLHCLYVPFEGCD